MLCERCEDNEATVQQITIVNDQVTHKRLCESCAEEEEPNSANKPGASVSSIMSNLYESSKSNVDGLTCSECGLGFEEFRSRERVGCSSCYEAFSDKLEPLIHRIHGADQHVGRSTKSTTPATISDERKIQRLEKELERTVQDEDYEHAAELRDRIEGLKGND